MSDPGREGRSRVGATARVGPGAGFSLVEVLVALVVLVTGVCAIASAVGHSSRAARKALDRVQAEGALAEKLEELRAASYAALSSGRDQVSRGGVPVSRRWTVDPGPVDGTRRIRVEVSWTDGVTASPSTDPSDPGGLLDLQRLRRTLGMSSPHRRSAVLLRTAR